MRDECVCVEALLRSCSPFYTYFEPEGRMSGRGKMIPILSDVPSKSKWKAYTTDGSMRNFPLRKLPVGLKHVTIYGLKRVPDRVESKRLL